MNRKKKLIIFDLDGTLYELRGGSYRKSALRRYVLSNAQDFIASHLKLDKKNARRVLGVIQKKYGEEISIGLEKKFSIDRYDYFNTVWNIPARTIVKKTLGIRRALTRLKKKYRLVLVSDAPKVWIDNVLKELKVRDLFGRNIYSGEGNRRKGFGNTFIKIIRDYKVQPDSCIAVGDQENTDIIPARQLGMSTIFVSCSKQSCRADVSIRSIIELPIVLKNQ